MAPLILFCEYLMHLNVLFRKWSSTHFFTAIHTTRFFLLKNTLSWFIYLFSMDVIVDFQRTYSFLVFAFSLVCFFFPDYLNTKQTDLV